MQGRDDGETGVDDDFARRALSGFGAFILGRNMFGPVRGRWPDDEWKGWWGDEPPYHAPTFVLTHHPRASIEMNGGTTFHFVTDGIEAVLKQARLAAKGRDVKVVVAPRRTSISSRRSDRQTAFRFVPGRARAGRTDAPEIDRPALAYRVTEHQATDHATHIVLNR